MSSTPNPKDAARLVSLADEEAVKEILGATVLDLWKVVNNLTRLRPSKRERYRVAIFGSARAQPGTYVYDEVKRAAAAFAAMGCDIVTGGGPGLIGLLVLFAGFALLFVGRYPLGIFDCVLGLDRWVARVVAYVSLMTDEYPPFRLDQGAAERAAVSEPQPGGQPPPEARPT